VKAARLVRKKSKCPSSSLGTIVTAGDSIGCGSIQISPSRLPEFRRCGRSCD